MNQATAQQQARDADAFLAACGWKDARREKLAGDASFRHYERVWLNDRPGVLMDAPPDKEDVRPFVQVTRFLGQCGLSAPALLGEDAQQGFLLLEDLGNDSFTRVLKAADDLPARELALYTAAVDVLLHLHTDKEVAQHLATTSLPAYDEALLMREVKLFSEWFLPQIVAPENLAVHQGEFEALWRDLLRASLPARRHFVHRDYHADNLMWLPQRAGEKRVGLLDYQDAVVGHAAYDLVSLLEDARRDLLPQTTQAMLEHYIRGAKVNREAFLADYALLGAQRNCKIVGIFVRLGVRDGKRHYVNYLPRVWGHLQHDLSHPRLSALRAWMDRYVPSAARGAITLR